LGQIGRLSHRRFRRAGLVAILLTLLLVACGGGASQPGDGSSGQEPESGETPAGGPAAAEALTPTEAPAREVVLCADHRPESLFDGADLVAGAIWRLVSPQAAVFGADYTAEAGDLLTALPDEADGTLHDAGDTLVVTLRYRDDLVWSDGEPFDTADALLSMALPAPGGLMSALEPLSATQVDGTTLEVTLPRDAGYPYVPPQPPLPAHLFDDAAALDAVDASELLAVTLGSYYLAEDAGGEMVFEANPNYPGDLAAGSIHLRFMDDPAAALDDVTSGACDLALDGALTAEQIGDLLTADSDGVLRAYVRPGPVSDQLILNTYPVGTGRPAYFADVRVRQAVAKAVDRAALVGDLWGGAIPVMDGWLPPDHWAYPASNALTTYAVDAARAGALLDEAGWRDEDGDGVREYHGGGGAYACQRGEWTVEEGTPLAPTLVIPADDALRAAMANSIAAELRAVGVDVRIAEVAPGMLYSVDGPLVLRQFDMALLAALAGPEPDGISRWVGADVFRHPLSGEPVHRWELEDRWLSTEQMIERLAYSNIPNEGNGYQGGNFAGWCNEEADLAIVAAEALAYGTAERQPFYAQHLAVVAEDVPVLPIAPRPRIAAGVTSLCGVNPGPYDPLTWNIANWTFDESGACADLTAGR
jgi:peptide/nickel transport system substrate-binding protein